MSLADILPGINFIGDPHLGRVFKTGVPLDRLGEREENVWQDFEARIMARSRLTIIVGDLFDKFTVAPEVTLRAFNLIDYATMQDSNKKIVILRGNHDASRDEVKASSFDILVSLLRDNKSVTFVEDVQRITVPDWHDHEHLHLVVFGWGPFQSSIEQAEKFLQTDPTPDFPITAAIGHWDTTGYDKHSPVPMSVLRTKTSCFITGHEHKPCVKDYGDCKVYVIGSMQPYAHGEQADGDDTYLTISPDEYYKIQLDKGDDFFKDKNLRIVLTKDQVFEEVVNCRALTFKDAATPEVDEEVNTEVVFDTFDFDALLGEAFNENATPEWVRELITTSLAEEKNHD